LENDKFIVFPGCCLEGHESTLAEGVADVEMLENLAPAEDDGWIRRCNFFLGEGAGCSGSDRVQTFGRDNASPEDRGAD
jgi:hypothetical protein